MIKKILLIIGVFLFSLTSAEIIWGGDSSVPFVISGDVPVCVGGIQWRTSTSTVSSLDDCYRSNGYLSNTCCPYPTHGCNFDILTGVGVCEILENPIYLCGDYKDEQSCTNTNSSTVINNSVVELTGGNLSCGKQEVYDDDPNCVYTTGNCACIWELGECKTFFNISRWCGGYIESGNCSFGYDNEPENYCETTGYMIYKNIATWVGNNLLNRGNCVDRQTQIPCAKGLIKLPGFSILAIIASLIIIASFYFYKRKLKVYKH
jgi:hypothetical protein